MSDLSNFAPQTTIAGTNYLVGYTAATSGGEARWTWSNVKNQLSIDLPILGASVGIARVTAAGVSSNEAGAISTVAGGAGTYNITFAAGSFTSTASYTVQVTGGGANGVVTAITKTTVTACTVTTVGTPSSDLEILVFGF